MATPAKAAIALLLLLLVLLTAQLPLGSCNDTRDGPEAASSSASTSQQQQQQQQCLSRCAACQSLRPARVGLICAHGPLSNCGCSEFALNLTSAAVPPEASSSDASKNCPPVDDETRIGYCPYGQQTDATTGCPLPVCRPAPGCRRSEQLLLADECRTAHCPAGFQTDADGCPVCRCFGAPSASTTQPPQQQPPPQPQLPCLLRCPNSCGRYGYADGESRDERGCVRDCACRCPAVSQACPNAGDRCRHWEIDRFGCQVCSACSSGSSSTVVAETPITHASPSACITKAALQAGGTTIGRLCPAKCPADYLLAEDRNSGCLTCTCHRQQQQQQSAADSKSNSNNGCPREPRCANSCGPHGRLRDPRGCVAACACDCPGVDLKACLASCPSGNVTVAKDAYGCHECRCSSNQQQHQPICPLQLQQRCSNSCGPHGYEADSVTGCQMSCRCSCPNNSRCSRLCFYGSRQDAYGCDTCECVSASEYLGFAPF